MGSLENGNQVRFKGSSLFQLSDPSLVNDDSFIHGKWVSAKSGKRFDVLDPGSGITWASCPDGAAEDANAAVESASEAFKTYSIMNPRRRAQLLLAWHNLILAARDDIAKIITHETGKPLAEAQGEIDYATGFTWWFAGEAERIHGSVSTAAAPNKRTFIIKQPIGVAVALVPWNFPMAMILRKAGAALAAGCTMVVKPSPETPITVGVLAQLAIKAGFPPGALNVVTTSLDNTPIVSETMCLHPLVKKVTFTGSTRVGKIVAGLAAQNLKKTSLELGGNCPFIIFDDANIDTAVTQLQALKWRHAGQACITANRVYIQSGVYEKVANEIVERTRKLVVGHGTDKKTTLGPVTISRGLDKAESIAEDALKAGGKLLLGTGKRLPKDAGKDTSGSGVPSIASGFFMEPTIVGDMSDKMSMTCEEVFGPVLGLYKFETEEEVTRRANDTPMGLASYVFTQDVNRFWRMFENLEAGMIGLNSGSSSAAESPFGGIKYSGYGKESGKDVAVQEYLIAKTGTFTLEGHSPYLFGKRAWRQIRATRKGIALWLLILMPISPPVVYWLMASIKAIESTSVHRIQSGQVIVDLCSVVKELVENSLDAGATSVEIRFKNQGLDAIEVADNGSGISRDDYESVALKHFTSKLRKYDDLSELDTFGFRGEALSSLCALSDVHIVTTQENEAPKATRLDFAPSGALKGTSTVAAQRGTTVYVETIFKNLPVRRQELNRNIKREYNKVLSLLQSYACISTTARVTVSNLAAKGKKTIVFATKAKQTTRENIANVFGTKTTAALIPLDLQFKMKASTYGASDSQVRVSGHVSRPTVGEGRQMADRQMFFVNGRPCALPQVAKVMNEVYKSYNLTQSPFIFANMEMDTNAYDVNVSPDKRTILLHEQGTLLESLRASLLDLFESHQQSVPQAMLAQTSNIPSAFRKASSLNQAAEDEPKGDESLPDAKHESFVQNLRSQFTPEEQNLNEGQEDLVRTLSTHKANERDSLSNKDSNKQEDGQSLENLAKINNNDERQHQEVSRQTRSSDAQQDEGLFVSEDEAAPEEPENIERQARPAPDEKQAYPLKVAQVQESDIHSVHTTPVKDPPGPVPSAFDRMRPLRTPGQQATVTIGDQTITTTIGGASSLKWGFGSDRPKRKVRSRVVPDRTGKPSFLSSLRAFAAPGTQEVSDEDGENPDTASESSDSPGSPEARHLEFKPANADEEGQKKGVDRESIVPSEGESDKSDSDGEYIDDKTKKEMEDARVAELIRDAEEQTEQPSGANLKRVGGLLKGGHRDATTRLQLHVPATTESTIEHSERNESFAAVLRDRSHARRSTNPDVEMSAEERLSLAVSKEDFEAMQIAGQFNLGFILASRPAIDGSKRASDDELFIIDQHASDEKYNFERLQATTIVQNQNLVNSQRLDLTAVEEEIILENQDALLQNGFEIQIDESGDYPVGKRCTLVSLPMSREVTFSTRDLEELIALLAESPTGPGQVGTSLKASTTQKPLRESTFSNTVVRPSAVRKMFAMRACRSSIMIGKTLNHKQMRGLVDNMGKMDKPWNCPHGRPTMRHLYSFGNWKPWSEGDGVAGMSEDKDFRESNLGNGTEIDWSSWLNDVGENDSESEGSSGESGLSRADSGEAEIKEETDSDNDDSSDEDNDEDEIMTDN